MAFEKSLYHGTIDAIARIDVSRGRLRKDFGQGFYMAIDLDQAIGMMHKKFREADLAVKEFEELDWKAFA